MPRFFKPVGGFQTAPNVKAIRIEDDGDAFQVHQDGTDKRTGFVGPDYRWVPDRTVEEMENLVRGGSWMEVENADSDIGVIPLSRPVGQPNETPQVSQAGEASPTDRAAQAASTRSKPAPPPADVQQRPQQPLPSQDGSK